MERAWCRQRVAWGPLFDPVPDKDADLNELDADRAELDDEICRDESRRPDAAAGLCFDDTLRTARERYSLRLVYLHMISEYARGNGRTDLLRPCLDGTTGGWRRANRPRVTSATRR